MRRNRLSEDTSAKSSNFFEYSVSVSELKSSLYILVLVVINHVAHFVVKVVFMSKVRIQSREVHVYNTLLKVIHVPGLTVPLFQFTGENLKVKVDGFYKTLMKRIELYTVKCLYTRLNMIKK